MFEGIARSVKLFYSYTESTKLLTFHKKFTFLTKTNQLQLRAQLYFQHSK